MSGLRFTDPGLPLTFDTAPAAGAFAFSSCRHGEARTHGWGRHPVTPDTHTGPLGGQQGFGKVKASSAQEFLTRQAPSPDAPSPRCLSQASSGKTPILTEQPHVQGTKGCTVLSDSLPKRRGFRKPSALPPSSQSCCEGLSRALGLSPSPGRSRLLLPYFPVWLMILIPFPCAVRGAACSEKSSQCKSNIYTLSLCSWNFCVPW